MRLAIALLLATTSAASGVDACRSARRTRHRADGDRRRKVWGPVIATTVAMLLAMTSVASARTIHGLVFDDTNGDGVPSAGEKGVAGVVVAYDARIFATTDASGQYDLVIPPPKPPVPSGAKPRIDPNIVWARVPDGFVPGPAWTRVGARDEGDIALHRLAAPHRGPLTFTIAADTHLAGSQPFALDLTAAAREATALDPPPAFFTILGDVTQGNLKEQFELVDASLGGLGVPYIPVPGNHDWYDGGTAWFAHYGPDNYSFDIDKVHFVVWNMALPDADVHAYLGAELASVAPDMTIVALTHAPPPLAVLRTLRQLGVDYLLTAHTHSNRVVDHGGLVELTTEPLLMGGLDFTPAGYRIATIDHGTLTTVHHAVVEAPHLGVIVPDAGRCVPPTGAKLVAAAELDAGATTVTARVDCATPIMLGYAGGWTWRAELPLLTPGRHTVSLEARSFAGAHTSAAIAIDVCESPAPPPSAASWPQVGGGPEHANAAPREVPPPLATRWATPVGGNIVQAPPAVDRDTVYIAVTDLGSGATGGVVALDLPTGAIRWRTPTSLPVRGGPAVVGNTVVAATIDGTVIGFDTASGELRWTYDIGGGLLPEAATVMASPAADGKDVFVGNQRYLAAIDAATGAALWAVDPVPKGENSQSLAAVAITNGLAIGTFNRAFGGVGAWDRTTGKLVWRIDDDRTIAINAAPVADVDTVYMVNGLTEVFAVDSTTAVERWYTKLDPTGFDWGHATIGTPALGRGVLVVPILYGDLVALDARSGAELWRHTATPGPLRTNHYRGHEPAFEASPVITGDIVWAADTAGRLDAYDVHTGAPLWHTELGAPVLAGLAVAGNWLIAASFDGTVRALAPADREAALATPLTCDAPASGGCCSAGTPDGSLLLALVVVLRVLRLRPAHQQRRRDACRVR